MTEQIKWEEDAYQIKRSLTDLSEQLKWHDQRSHEWYESISKQIERKPKESKMGMDNVSDKVNINVGDGGGRGYGDSGAGLAAVIAALGNRNQGYDMAGLIAALGNRNDDSNNLAPLMAMMGMNNRRDDGMGMNGLWPILLLALLRGRGGFGGFGGDGDCGPVASPGGVSPALAALLQTLTEGQSNLRADVPRVALENQNAFLQSIGSLALGTQQGFANTGDKIQAANLSELAAISGVKDSVMNNASLIARDLAAVNQNVSAQGCQTRETVLASEGRIIAKLDQNTIEDLRDRASRAERAIEVNALRSQVEITNTNTATATQAQAQGQFQIQLQDIGNRLARVCDRIDIVHQEQRSTNANIIAGNTGAVGVNQTSTPTQVNAR